MLVPRSAAMLVPRSAAMAVRKPIGVRRGAAHGGILIGSRAAHRTTTFPRSMSIPQVNLNSPALAGVNSTTTGRFSGSGFFTL